MRFLSRRYRTLLYALTLLVALLLSPLNSSYGQVAGGLSGWGYNNYGQITVPAGTDYEAVAAGGWHGLALKSDGSLVGWGRDDYGQASPPAGTDYVAIAGGASHSLALKSDGSLVGWGYNNYGQITVPAGTDYEAVAAGYWYSLALKSDGSLVGWGLDSDGRATPPAGTDYVAIAGGWSHGLALKSDGSLVGWGRNTDGQATPPAGTDYVAIAAGTYHSLALKSDGSLVGWGSNSSGQINVPAGTDYVAIAAGTYHSLAIVLPGITVTPTSGLTTTEAGATDTFGVALNTQPTASVTVALSSSDITEGTVSPESLVFDDTNWSTPQTVTVTGVDDAVADGSQAYTIQTGAAESDDPNYNGLNPADVSVTNLDDEISHDLTVNKTGAGTGTITSTPAGIDCGATCSAGFVEGARVTVAATPDFNSAFDGWSGGGCLGNGDCTLLMDKDSTITATFNPDVDSDGISDVMEDAGPYGGDGNRDGTLDSVQANVASFRTINGEYVTLISETGSELKAVMATVNPSSNDAPGWASFPQGFFGFKVTGLTPGQKTTVSLILHQIHVITTYYKYGPTPDTVTDHWYRFFSDGTIGARIVQKSYSTTIFLDFIDGLRGDDDLLANGEIVDLGAPTIPASTGDSGCFISQAASRPPVTK